MTAPEDFPTLELTADELLAEHGCILPPCTRSESIPGTWEQGPRWVSFSRNRLGPDAD